VKTISFQVSDKVYERLTSQKIRHETWRNFFLLCVIRHCMVVLGMYQRVSDTPTRSGMARMVKEEDITLFQREIGLKPKDLE